MSRKPCTGSCHQVQTMDNLSQTYEGTDWKSQRVLPRDQTFSPRCVHGNYLFMTETSSTSYITFPSQWCIRPAFRAASHPLMQVARPNLTLTPLFSHCFHTLSLNQSKFRVMDTPIFCRFLFPIMWHSNPQQACLPQPETDSRFSVHFWYLILMTPRDNCPIRPLYIS